MTADVLTVDRVGKRFPPNVVALEEASLSVKPGEVHCLLGANGAGKSTLLKIIAGAIRPSKGELMIDGRAARLKSPIEAARAGISMIYQELDLVPQLTVEQNLFLGRAPHRFGFLNGGERRRRAAEALHRVGATFSPEARLESLSIANQQLTAIARSLTMQARLIIMDEPSTTLSDRELEGVFAVIRDLVANGISILYVSHRLHEIRTIGKRVTVLRSGRTVETFNVRDASEKELVDAVIGTNKALIERTPRRTAFGAHALEVRKLASAVGLEINDLNVRWGEIVGLTGLTGSGRTSLLKALFGELSFSGDVRLDGKPYHPGHPAEAIRCGLGLVPENRKTEGLVLDAALYRNATLPWLRRRRLANQGAMKREAEAALRALGARYAHVGQPARQLSGGNQQKIVLAKWIIEGCRILLLDEPSRGLDVGAKTDFYRLVRELAENGAAVLVASSELEELCANCDRIFVLHEGRNVAAFDPSVTNHDEIERVAILGAKQ